MNYQSVVKELSNERPVDIKNYYNNGPVKEGKLKPGLQTHVHIVVSRKDKSMEIKISPLAHAKGQKANHFGKETQVGFDRNQFKLDAETLFDKQFDFQRQYQEYYSYTKGNQQTVNILASQINSYLQQATKFKGIHEQDMGQKERLKTAHLTQSLANRDPKSIVQNIIKMGQYDSLDKGDLGRMNQGQFLKFAATLTKANPVTIVKEVVQIIKNTLSHDI